VDSILIFAGMSQDGGLRSVHPDSRFAAISVVAPLHRSMSYHSSDMTPVKNFLESFLDGVYCPLQGLGRDVMNTATGTFRKANALELPYRANALCAYQDGKLRVVL
jgi:hypothetical protein